jgi:DNA-directed RNA polymerase alpha subunit
LEREGINTVDRLSQFSEEEILALHGMGPGSLPKLRAALKASGLHFKIKK